VLPAIVDFVGDDLLVAHQASFDIGVIERACKADGMPWPELRYTCSYSLAQRLISLPSYKLPAVVHAMGGALDGQHHDALVDAHGVVMVTTGLARGCGANDVPSLVDAAGLELEHLLSGYDGDFVPVVNMSSNRTFWPPRPTRPAPNLDADPTGPLYGRVVVVTGELQTDKQQAFNEIAAAGATIRDKVSGKTNIVVVGYYDGGVTDNARRACAERDKGREILIWSEDDLLRCLGRPTVGAGA
jgi:DNA polymerase-3 subunit epsilon